MVIKITDNGLVVGMLPVPGLTKTISFDEIEDIEITTNGKGDRCVLRIAGGKSIALSDSPKGNGGSVIDELRRIIYPPEAAPGRSLMPGEINSSVIKLCSMRGARPSAVLKLLLDQAIRANATDIHFDYLDGIYKTQMRMDGVLHEVAEIPGEFRERLIAHIKNSADLLSYKRDTVQEGRMTFPLDGRRPLEVRVSIAPAHGEESVAMRLFDALRADLTIDDLGFSEGVKKSLNELLGAPRGLILLAGPSSSGKTTTIYSVLKKLMKGKRAGQKAVALEDPIEFPLDCVSQIEVVENKGLTFDKLLSNVLRQDAEVISVGEIRDSETARIVLRAALTGHFIMSTVHCGAAVEVPRRLINLGLDPIELSECLAGIIAQRLVRVICPRCKVEKIPDDETRRCLAIPDSVKVIYKGKGCENCLNTGYKGRTAIAEVIRVNGEISEMLSMNSPVTKIREKLSSTGFRSLHHDGVEKIINGITTIDEIKRVLG